MRVIRSVWFFPLLFLTLALAVSYNTVTLMAGTYIASDLGGSPQISGYPMIFFGLGNALSIPFGAPLAERWGRVGLLTRALFLYALFSLLCSLAPTYFLFNLFRLGEGIASGPFFVAIRLLILTFAPAERKDDYNNLRQMSYAVLPVVGACFGAWLGYESHWRLIFHINTPIAFSLALYFWVHYRDTDPLPKYREVDWIGAFFYVIGLFSLVTSLTLAQELDWFRSPLFTTLFSLSLPSLLFWIIWELKSPHPFIELNLLKSPTLAYALLNLSLLFAAYFGMILLLSIWLSLYVRYTPLWIGALLATMLVAGSIGYWLRKRWLPRIDLRILLGASILLFSLSCYVSTYFDVEVDFFHLAFARSLAGFGLVLFIIPLFRLTITSYGEEKGGSLFALFQMTRCISSSLGAALYTTAWQRRQVFFHERLGETLTPGAELTRAFLERGVKRFHLTPEQSLLELENALQEQATSLALNDVFGLMGWILFTLFIALLFTYRIPSIHRAIRRHKAEGPLKG